MPASTDATPPYTTPRILVAVTTGAMIVLNVLANALPFFGRGTGEVSALYPSLVTPAPWASVGVASGAMATAVGRGDRHLRGPAPPRGLTGRPPPLARNSLVYRDR